MYYVYILECRDHTLYTGITTNYLRRFEEHKRGVGANYTRSHPPTHICYIEKVEDRSQAQKREAEIKRLSRADKLILINKHKNTTKAYLNSSTVALSASSKIK